MSIRKVLGAMPGNIALILSKDFLVLVLLASGVAFPLAWWAMSSMTLQNFSYRVNLSWIIFVTAGSIAFGIALLTISFQAINLALSNPSKSLRAE